MNEWMITVSYDLTVDLCTLLHCVIHRMIVTLTSFANNFLKTRCRRHLVGQLNQSVLEISKGRLSIPNDLKLSICRCWSASGNPQTYSRHCCLSITIQCFTTWRPLILPMSKRGPASAGKAKAGMVHSVSEWTRGVQVKLWDPLRVPYLSTLKVCSRQGAIQIHVYLYLYYHSQSRI